MGACFMWSFLTDDEQAELRCHIGALFPGFVFFCPLGVAGLNIEGQVGEGRVTKGLLGPWHSPWLLSLVVNSLLAWSRLGQRVHVTLASLGHCFPHLLKG